MFAKPLNTLFFFRLVLVYSVLLGNTFSRASFSVWAGQPVARVGGLEGAQLFGGSVFTPLESSLCGRALTTRRALDLWALCCPSYFMNNHSLVDSKSILRNTFSKTSFSGWASRDAGAGAGGAEIAVVWLILELLLRCGCGVPTIENVGRWKGNVQYISWPWSCESNPKKTVDLERHNKS